ncbi:hypothetical protein ALQ18_01603 [Pseudomonas marginalis pv. marginalis]|nr:hypothetical protein ALQ18_01603 [Pseudomonas marginalis pv. marginalis]
MNINFKKKNGLALSLLAMSALNLFHGSIYADECPSDDFAKFLPAFSANVEAQQRLTALKVNALVLKPSGEPGNFGAQTKAVNRSTLAFPIMLPIDTLVTKGVEVEEVDANNVSVIDKRAGNSHIKVFNFFRQACWSLESVQDWSINQNDLPVVSKPGRSTAQNYCYQRAHAYEALGASGQYRLTGEFFEASLENYLCAAASGDPEASLNAASLSLSGMAPQLETAKVEALLKAAATTLAEGAASLSTFYCYGNNTAPQGTCEHPEQAEKELIRAASMGSVDATNYLGYSFEKGELVTHDLSRAVACYRLAAAKGNQAAANNLNRLNTQTTDVISVSSCY